jgi:sugar transferase (PEP-CTERM/EpsH1 system associated)
LKSDILFLTHCAPTIPDKGERIRAYHEVRHLAKTHRVHVAGLAREERPFVAVPHILPDCASVYIELLRHRSPIYPLLRLAAGDSLTASFYRRRSLERYVRTLCREVRFAATIAFTSAMAPYAPEGVPLLLDLVDVDSEKWSEYTRVRWPKTLFRIEAERLQREEIRWSRRAASIMLTTEQERALLDRIAPGLRSRAIENGVDFEYYNPERVPALPELAGRRYIVMVGSMGYYPNDDGAVWFANEVFAPLREKLPELEFLVVGSSPPAAVRRLNRLPGVSVSGYVPDVRPYIAQALTTVAPLRIARGIQNKVLEALAMGKTVLASDEICRTFGPSQPLGVIRCGTGGDYQRLIVDSFSSASPSDPRIREAAAGRFSWARNLAAMDEELEFVISRGRSAAA